MRVIIIEDELFTAKDLERTVKTVEPNIEVIAILQSVEEAIDYFKNNGEPDLIFSDIQLGKHLSFEIFKKIKISAPVIFCTAYNEYALEAFNSNGIDYLLKPFNKNSIEKTLEKYQNLKQKFNKSQDEISIILNKIERKITNKSSSIVVFVGDKIIPIEISNIAVFYVENEITYALTFDNKKYSVNEKLETLETNNVQSFFRANRQFLINRKAIKDAANYFNRKLIVNLSITFEQQIIISKLRKADFLAWLTEA